MTDFPFRILFILAFIAMLGIRIYYQRKVFREKRKINFREGKLSLIAGSVAALTTIIFGAEYIFNPGFFGFAYTWQYAVWLRWVGFFMLFIGIAILGFAHHHLGKSFSSFVVSKDKHVLVESGPYRWVRHPIYTAYLLNYIGGGLLAGNWVLTIIPVSMFAILVAIRLEREEKVMEETFGQEYCDYEKRTGRLLPRLRVER